MVNYSQFNESDDAGKRGFRCVPGYVADFYMVFKCAISSGKNKGLNGKKKGLLFADLSN